MSNIFKTVEPKAADWINHVGSYDSLYNALKDAKNENPDEFAAHLVSALSDFTSKLGAVGAAANIYTLYEDASRDIAKNNKLSDATVQSIGSVILGVAAVVGATAASPALLATAAAVSVGLAFYQLGSDDSNSTYIHDMTLDLVDSVDNKIDAITQYASEKIYGVEEYIDSKIVEVSDAYNTSVQQATESYNDAEAWITENYEAGSDSFNQALQDATEEFESAKESAIQVYDEATAALDRHLEATKEAVAAIPSEVYQYGEEVFDSAVDYLSGKIEAAEQVYDELSSTAQQAFDEAVKDAAGIYNDAVALANDTLEAGSEALDQALQDATDAWEQAQQSAQQLFDDALSNAAQLANSAKQEAQGVVDRGLSLLEEFGSDLGSALGRILGGANDHAPEISSAESKGSPIVLDLDGNSFDSISKNADIYFDHDNNGFAELTGWISGNDGFLVRDLDANGTIDSGAELFGNNTALASGRLALNGYEALAEFDTNNDGKVGSVEAEAAGIKVWIDKNSDGISQDKELKALTEVGVESLNTGYQNTSVDDGQGNTIKQTSTATLLDGSSINTADFWFDVDLSNTKENDIVEIDSTVNSLPNAIGFGNARSLHQAMIRDDELKNLVTQFVNAEDITNRKALLEPMIYRWLGAVDVDPRSRDENGVTYIDPRKVVALETLTGRGYDSGQGGNHVQGEHAAYILEDEFSKFSSYLYSQLMAQTEYLDIISKISWEINFETGLASPSFRHLESSLSYLEDTDLLNKYADTISVLKGLFSYSSPLSKNIDEFLSSSGLHHRVPITIENEIVGTGNDDEIYSNYGSISYIRGLDGDDILIGSSAYDYIHGGEGDDTLHDYYGRGILNGGAGNDTLSTHYGNISLKGGGGDDTLSVILGSNLLKGGTGDDTLRIEQSGNYDRSQSRSSNTLEGGAGNDRLEGSVSADTYVFNRGDGQDVINDYNHSLIYNMVDRVLFGDGITQDQVTVTREGNNIVLLIADPAGIADDRITLEDAFTAVQNKIELVEFADGSSLSSSELQVLAQKIRGTDSDDVILGTVVMDELFGEGGDDRLSGGLGNDQLYGGAGHDRLYGSDGNDTLDGGSGNDYLEGGAGNDTLDGGSGNDYLEGGAGNDRYFFGLGSGSDSIYDYDSTPGNQDVVLFTEGVTPDDVSISRESDHLILSINGTQDQLRLENWLSDDNHKVERVEFTNGTIWGVNELWMFAMTPSKGSDDIEGTEVDDIIDGRAGNDKIDGKGGNDELHGGTGNDILAGGTGSDELYGEAGSDSLDGGSGSDILQGGEGNDTYLFGLGSGVDYIYDYDETPENQDVVRFKEGVSANDIWVSRKSDHLLLSINGIEDQLRLENWFSNDASKVERVEFDDGTIWDVDALIALSLAPTGGNDEFKGSDANDVVDGLGGDDYIYGNDGNDILYGGTGRDHLYGGAGNDKLEGGAGNDVLEGGWGNDTYFFGLGSGSDHVYDFHSTPDNQDVVRFTEGVAADDVSVFRQFYNLILSIDGTEDQLRLSNWFSADSYKIERVEFADGTVWGVDHLTSFSLAPTEGDDEIEGTGIDDVINGLGGHDEIYGDDGNDTLDGGAGNDFISGGMGDDILDGGSGNDELQGAAGNDTYLFGHGSGVDSISEYDGTPGNQDVIRFTEGIAPDDVSVIRDINDLVLGIKGTEDQLRIGYWFASDVCKVEHVEFADGTVWGIDEITALSLAPTEGDDEIEGTEEDDVINGLGGHDEIYGDDGNDTLDGGAGDDYLDGGAGNDTYLFGRGSGSDSIYDYDSTPGNQDVVRFTEGIAPVDVLVSRNDGSLVLSINGTEDQLSLDDWFDDDASKVERVEFADGTAWGLDDLWAFAMAPTEGDDEIEGTEEDDVINGLGGHDEIYGNDGSDTLDGGAGDDYLDGGDGNDTYLFGRGSGSDSIYDYDSTPGNLDVVRFTEGVAPADVSFSRVDDDLVLSINGTEDQLSLGDWFDSDANKIERVEFTDGTVWGFDELWAFAMAPTEGDDEIEGTEEDDVLNGLGGDDEISGDDGNDTLDGGAGDDYLEGGAGNDTYLFGLGSGSDSIYDYDSTSGNQDVVRFTEGVAPADVSFSRVDDDLVLSINGTEDQLSLGDWFDSDANKIERVEFTDGTVWGFDELWAFAMAPTEGDDEIEGTEEDDVLNGLGGDDEISGGDGNDTLDGCAGDDYLEGGAGNDTYLFGLGSGSDSIYDYDSTSGNQDVVRFTEGVAPADISFSRDFDSLVLSINGTEDQLTLGNWFGSDTTKIERVEFADGTVWGFDELWAFAMAPTEGDDEIEGTEEDDVLNGLGGDDEISGDDGNDTLDGGAGDDYLEGGAGNDTYLFGLGSGSDSIYDYDSTPGNQDVIRFIEGVAAGDISVSQNLDDLVLSINDTEDQLVLRNWFSNASDSAAFKIERVEFSDGTVWGIDHLTSYSLAPTEGDDEIQGTEIDDVIDGLGGNDEIYGEGGNDILYGGAGNDILYGAPEEVEGEDNDTLDGGAGNDSLYGGAGNDTYIFGLGAGSDLIYDFDSTPGNQDVVCFTDGIAADDVSVSRESDHLILSIDGTEDQLVLRHWFGNIAYKVERVEFTDGTAWGIDEVQALAIAPTEGDDVVEGTEGDDVIDGLGGNDEIRGNDGNDSLYGGAGNDILIGAAEEVSGEDNDTLEGGIGNDSLHGGAGDDTYVFNLGDGQDSISDFEGGHNETDRIQFGMGLERSDLWFSQDGGDLLIDTVGTDDQIRIKNWYSSTQTQIEEIHAGGSVLTNNLVDQLVNAMAEFDVPAGDGAVLPQETKDQLAPVIASSWQPLA
ncbi:calcium-binding protein [Motiliproteus sp.]|uniref:calcium-binding protein n=1 Tax=Motiliproteus sp. TaxID=1898955 RepID=UPI003BAABD82